MKKIRQLWERISLLQRPFKIIKYFIWTWQTKKIFDRADLTIIHIHTYIYIYIFSIYKSYIYTYSTSWFKNMKAQRAPRYVFVRMSLYKEVLYKNKIKDLGQHISCELRPVVGLTVIHCVMSFLQWAIKIMSCFTIKIALFSLINFITHSLHLTWFCLPTNNKLLLL